MLCHRSASKGRRYGSLATARYLPAPFFRGGSAHMSDTPRPVGRGRLRLLVGAATALVVAAAVTMVATTAAHAESDRTLTSNSTGTHNGYFYSFWKDSGSASMTLRADGRYSSS